MNIRLMEKIFEYVTKHKNATEVDAIAFAVGESGYSKQYITAWFNAFYVALKEIFIIKEATFTEMTANFDKFENNVKSLTELTFPYFKKNPVTVAKYPEKTQAEKDTEKQQRIEELQTEIDMLEELPDEVLVPNPEKMLLDDLKNELSNIK